MMNDLQFEDKVLSHRNKSPKEGYQNSTHQILLKISGKTTTFDMIIYENPQQHKSQGVSWDQVH